MVFDFFSLNSAIRVLALRALKASASTAFSVYLPQSPVQQHAHLLQDVELPSAAATDKVSLIW